MTYNRSRFSSSYGKGKKSYSKAPVSKVAFQAIANPSPEQSAIFTAEFQNMIIEAVAGSGKTTTIVELLHKLPKCNALFLAFSKAIATELQTRIPEWAEGKTLHSLGYGAIAQSRRGRLFMKADKVYYHACDVLGVKDGRASLSDIDRKRNKCLRDWANFAKQVISLAKANLVFPAELPAQMATIVAEYDLEIPKSMEFDAIETIQTIYNETIEMPEIDFDDMIFLPNYNGLAMKSYDLILVDEAQDINAAQMGMLEGFRKANPAVRFVFVGDACQAIYGFRGAGTDSMSQIQDKFGATEKGLSVSFRCAKAIVKEAQKYVSHIQSHPDAPEGFVGAMEMDSFYQEVASDFMLCRKNAPMVAVCLALLARGKAATIVGRKVAENLKALINKLAKNNGETPLNELYEAVDAWEQNEIKKAQARNNERAVEEINDKAACLYALGENLETTQQLLDNIEAIFHKDENGKGFEGTKLMTFHKSKGLESDRVFILPTNPIKTNLDWQATQENNLHYVSVTRAKRELIYLPNPEAKK